MSKQTVKAQCGSCGGTGLYSGMCEGKGQAVICLSCDGTGCALIEYIPYAGRKRKTGITSVSRSRGSFIATGVGAVGASMTYQEFLKAVPEAQA